MSVWKESAYQLGELMMHQHLIYTDAADAGYVTSATGNARYERMAANDKDAVDEIRAWLQENLKYGTVEHDDTIWTAKFDMAEGVDDGRKYGWEATVTFIKDKRQGVNFVNVSIRSL